MFFFFGVLPIDQSKIKHTKKLKEIPSRHVLENPPEKASMYAFIHLKLISNLQGFCQYILADMLNIIIADKRKYSGIVFLGLKNSLLLGLAIFINPHVRVYGKLRKLEKNEF